MRFPYWLSAVFSVVLAALLPACDAVNLPELKPGVSTASEVRARLGLPGAEYQNDDGSVTMEYSRQPEGVVCYMITVGKDQVMQKMEQVLTEANYARIKTGLSKDEVRRILGKPGSIQQFKLKGEEVWDWKVAGTIPTEEKHFHVHFGLNTGMVTGTSSRVEAK